jgi:hypothetical protein
MKNGRFALTDSLREFCVQRTPRQLVDKYESNQPLRFLKIRVSVVRLIRIDLMSILTLRAHIVRFGSLCELIRPWPSFVTKINNLS